MGKIKALLTRCGLRYVTFYLNYNTKLMQQYGHWKRQRGLANSRSLEQIFYVYKGRRPSKHPKVRKFVDAGSSLFQQDMKSVPVLAPKNHAYVSKTVRDASLASMLGVPQDEDPDEKEKKRLEDEEAASGEEAEEGEEGEDGDGA